MLEELKQEMIKYYEGDPKRIQHFIKVYFFCEMIGESEHLSEQEMFILRSAALTHDIGIKRAEELFGSTNGKFQEALGPSIAREMLTKIGYDTYTIERICFLIAHHHTYDNIKNKDYQILVEADFLVNLYEDDASLSAVNSAREKIFKTEMGKHILDTMFKN